MYLFTQQIFSKTLSYQEYRNLIKNLLEEGKTTGDTQSPELTDYAKLNEQRMNRLDKTAVIHENLIAKIKKIQKKQTWLILTEGWCGDAAQNIPFLVKMAEYSPYIEIKFLLRDENLTIMDSYLTNGTRSIPKLIILDENLKEINTWGPRPQILQNIFNEYKKNNVPKEEFIEKIHLWYTQNKGEALQKEIFELF
jgi:xanthine dehydrogenase iron-sulfur cluster and FAD-binding subunit A